MENFTITWDDQFALGITMIDDQHKTLIQLANRLFKLCDMDGDFNKKTFLDYLWNTIEYAKHHFNIEAKLLEVIQYPNLKEHIREHESFISVLQDEARAFQEGREDIPRFFAQFIREWTIAHIAYQDRRYVRHIHEIMKQGQSCRAMDTQELECFPA